MSSYFFPITLTFEHRIFFGKGVFELQNPLLDEVFDAIASPRRVLVFVEEMLVKLRPDLPQLVERRLLQVESVEELLYHSLPGAEACKATPQSYQDALQVIESARLDRHSLIAVIGGGAFLDVIGFAAATAHRGIPLLRFPTTTLSQDDSGVGVKNGINAFGKKNWLGTFAIPAAVVNDFDFLHSQPETQRRAGLVEAVKVALVKDAEFFHWIESQAQNLAALVPETLEACVERSALLHAQHIAQGGDPFELGSSRPLDFGHWAAHKLEQLTNFQLSHADAVAVGMALDVTYSVLAGHLKREDGERILAVLEALEMPTWHAALELGAQDSEDWRLLEGLEEFREHLGGCLTILLLKSPGRGVEVHEMRSSLILQAIFALHLRQACRPPSP